MTDYLALHRNMKDTERVLRKIGVTHCLGNGVVLGIIRDGDLIEWDPDIDFRILGADKWPEIVAEMLEAGFTVEKRLGTYARGCEMKFMRDDAQTDIVSLYDLPKQGIVWKCAWGGTKLDEPIPSQYTRELFLNPLEVIFHGVRVFLPNPPARYLVEQYGRNWMVPNPKWRWWDDPPCIIPHIPGEGSDDD